MNISRMVVLAVLTMVGAHEPAYGDSSLSSCVNVRDDSNFAATRKSIENGCGVPVRVSMCARSTEYGRVTKSSIFAPWNGSTQTGFDFPPNSTVRYRVCRTAGICDPPDC